LKELSSKSVVSVVGSHLSIVRHLLASSSLSL
jgi:hypothetical protein